MSQEKTILITGTSTGIGRATALYLDSQGYRVFAGVRKQEDGNNLKRESSEKLEPVIRDGVRVGHTQVSLNLKRLGKEWREVLGGLFHKV